MLQLPRRAQFQLPQFWHSQSPTPGSMPGGRRLPLARVVHPPPWVRVRGEGRAALGSGEG